MFVDFASCSNTESVGKNRWVNTTNSIGFVIDIWVGNIIEVLNFVRLLIDIEVNNSFISIYSFKLL